MAGAYSRKKQPETVRRALLDEATKLAAEGGLSAVTVSAVAQAAGVTKGGLFHHFPSKRALVEGVFRDLLERLDAEIDERIAADPEPRGRYTRAYVEASFSEGAAGACSWSALSVSMIADPDLRRLWSVWSSERMSRHRETDGSVEFEIIRLAADGCWYANVLGPGAEAPADVLRDRLISMTRNC